MSERSLPTGFDQPAQPPMTDYAPKANGIGDGDELFYDGSAPPPNYSTISGYQNLQPQASAYENFASYTVMGIPNQQVNNQQSPMLLRDIKRSGAWMQSDPNLLQDRSGPKMAGVGILFHQEPSYGIYVANLVLNSSAHRCGAILLGDCLTAVDGIPVPPNATLDHVSRLVLGAAATFVHLSFRRPGPHFAAFFDVRLLRGGGPPDPAGGLRRTQSEGGSPPHPGMLGPNAGPSQPGLTSPAGRRQQERAAPPGGGERAPAAAPEDPRDRRLADLQAQIRALEERKLAGKRSREEAARLAAAAAAARERVAALEAERDRLVMEADGHRARLAPLEEELRERAEDLRRCQEMHARSQERVREAERTAQGATEELAGAQAAHDALAARGAQLAKELAGVAEGAAAARQEGRSKDELLARIDAEAERMAGFFRVDAAAAEEVRAHLARAAAGHAAALEALRAQEGQMAQLADVIPALDMAHSALLSAAVPRREPVDRLLEPVLAPQLLATPGPRPLASFAAPAGGPPGRFAVERRSVSPPAVRVVVDGGDAGGWGGRSPVTVRSAAGGPGAVLYASSPYFQGLQARPAVAGRLYATAEHHPLPLTHSYASAGAGAGLYASRSSVVSESIVSRRPLVPPPASPGVAGGPAGGGFPAAAPAAAAAGAGSGEL